MSQVMLKDFSNADFIAWIEANIPLRGRVKTDLMHTLQEEEIDGTFLQEIENCEDFVELGIIKIAARKLFRQLKATFPNEFAVTSNTNKKLSNTNFGIEAMLARKEQIIANRHYQGQKHDAATAKAGFKVSLFVGNERKVTHNTFTINNTVLDLKKEIAQNEVGGDPDNVKLYYNSKPLKDDETLGACCITSSSCYVTGGTRVRGGRLPAVSDEKDNNKINSIEALLARRQQKDDTSDNNNNNSSCIVSDIIRLVPVSDEKDENTIGSDNNNNNNKSFKVTVFIGNRRKETHNTFTINNTVRDLKEEIAQNEVGGDPDHVQLYYNSKPLKHDETLGACGITSSSCYVSGCMRVTGGAGVANNAMKDHIDGTNKVLWPNSVVPYKLDNSVESISPNLKRLINLAINDFNSLKDASGNIVVEWRKKRKNDNNWVNFIQNSNEGPYSEEIGKKKGNGGQYITLPAKYYPNSNGAPLKKICVMHEMMHAIGFYHEFCRDDEKYHCKSNKQAKSSNECVKFGQYDYKSIMQYEDRAAFIATNKEYSNLADKSETFSEGDKAALRRIYGYKQQYSGKSGIKQHFGEWHEKCEDCCTERSCKCGNCGVLGGINCGYAGMNGHWTCCMSENKDNLECNTTHTGYWHMKCDSKCTSTTCYCGSCGNGCTYEGYEGHWSCCNSEKFDGECVNSPYKVKGGPAAAISDECTNSKYVKKKERGCFLM